MKFTYSLIAAALLSGQAVANKAQLEFSDVFDFKYAKTTQLAEDGKFLALSAKPYRGDAQGQVYNLETNKLIATVEQGTKAHLNKSSTWAAFMQVPPLLESETASKKEKKSLKNNLVLVNTQSAKQHVFNHVKDYQLSDDGRWLAYREDSKAEQKDKNVKADAPKINADKKDKPLTLVIVDLASQQTQRFENVVNYGLSPAEYGVLFSQHDSTGAKNQVQYLDLNNKTTSPLFSEPGVTISAIAWHPYSSIVAFNLGNYVNEDKRRRSYDVTLWDATTDKLSKIESPSGWYSSKTAKLKWSEQGERLYFDNRPLLDDKIEKLKYDDSASLRDFDTIRQQSGINIWHNNDPEIKTREQNTWKKTNRERQYQAVYHIESQKVVQLADETVRDITLNTEADYLLGKNDQPYLEKIMYGGFYADYYAVKVSTGAKGYIVKDSPNKPSLSPSGRHAAYFLNDQIWLKDLHQQKEHAVSKAVRTAIFADDQHDYPEPNPGYGFAGWQKDGSTLYAYSKYDIWAFDSVTGQAKRLTSGKESNTRYRVIKLDKKQVGFAADETLFLSAHNLQNKQTHIAKLNLQTGAIETVLEGAARFDLVKKAKHADKVIFTQQSYHQFPDYWQSNSDFNTPKQVTNLNPQVKNFAWGQKPELIQYKGYNGEQMQGVLIKPADYQPGQKLPVVIYFYRYMSQRMYDFPKMELNHRPNFPMFTSNGYAVFLPDIRFEIGKPGPSSTQTLINAAQKLIDLGIADKQKIGLQGHSWAGYQSAFAVTQTDMFKAVVSGAPVSNMTSAYSGIRLKSGLARQFQYETGQSRIGKPLTEAPELYIENSPVFFADKVNTPILLMFGDKDGAVPWQEGIQYYLALRRHNKDAIFLQYEGEPHHLKQFPNQVDFSVRMMEYFDHYLRGMPAPQWITSGKPHRPEE
ncbi:prolyl oligopeptidase family serine peptidase [Pseudoalteromonas obscura]|uniref:Prolyl oligopeptidase family serine peptidase n=1 Tax=Pseudoalteromonas obscura TaxID=3048491 RepID=A0ABT7EQX1_9GAMM|nr:prolyl oligopeptidase family serine peptidase [Pseudoalteromonas sp. P94(2023)]MDK2597466.1 prolyl oligopeptidase family serine peptidase [Pseudoalteromonas sp. P94(2023)]